MRPGKTFAFFFMQISMNEEDFRITIWDLVDLIQIKYSSVRRSHQALA